ncbi:MAG: helicase-associated domain-containing protein, partial [Spirochaetota bacterium]
MFDEKKCLIVQSDMSIIADVHSSAYEDARDEISKFAELYKSPEHIHIYNITPISLWNAASLGLNIEDIKEIFSKYCKYEVSPTLINQIKSYLSKYGIVQINRVNGSLENDDLILTINDKYALTELLNIKNISKYLVKELEHNKFLINVKDRGSIKQNLIDLGYPVEDKAGYTEGDRLELTKKRITNKGKEFKLRAYQKQAADFFYCNG